MLEYLEFAKTQLLDLAPSVKIGLESGIKNAKTAPFIRVVSHSDELNQYNQIDLNFSVFIAIKKSKDLEGDYTDIFELAKKVKDRLHLSQLNSAVCYYQGSIDDTDDTNTLKVKVLNFAFKGIRWIKSFLYR